MCVCHSLKFKFSCSQVTLHDPPFSHSATHSLKTPEQDNCDKCFHYSELFTLIRIFFVNEYRHTFSVVYTDFWFSVRLRCRLMSRRTSLRKVSRLTSCCWHWSNTCSMHSMYCGVHFDNSSRDFSYFSFACSTHKHTL